MSVPEASTVVEEPTDGEKTVKKVEGGDSQMLLALPEVEGLTGTHQII